MVPSWNDVMGGCKFIKFSNLMKKSECVVYKRFLKEHFKPIMAFLNTAKSSGRGFLVFSHEFPPLSWFIETNKPINQKHVCLFFGVFFFYVSFSTTVIISWLFQLLGKSCGCVMLNMSMTIHVIAVSCENMISFISVLYLLSESYLVKPLPFPSWY